MQNRLTNRWLKSNRRTMEYAAVITDLYLIGIVSSENAKRLLGYDIPDYLHLEDQPCDKVATPTCDTPSGQIATGTLITFTCATESASIKYATDPDGPWQTGSTYTVTGNTGANVAVYVKAQKDNLRDSDVLSLAYTITERQTTPTIAVDESTDEATITSAGADKIYYRLDEDDDWSEYDSTSKPVVATEIWAYATASGKLDSAVAHYPES